MKSDTEREVDALLSRIRMRHYPETVPVLASYWLRTVCAGRHDLRWWKEIRCVLDSAAEDLSEENATQSIREIQSWIQENVVKPGRVPNFATPQPERYRPALYSQRLAAYTVRLMNEWLPVEVARMLVPEPGTEEPEEGIPVLATARALERLLVRDHLSRATLEEMLLSPNLSPECVYPANLEILRDILLWLLGRTSAPESAILPASLLSVSPDARLPANYPEALSHAALLARREGEQIHVPIGASEAFKIIRDEVVRIDSIIVTMDGRWWRAENMETGEQNYVAYHSTGRARIDFSGEHTHIRAPWPETRLHWAGDTSGIEPVRIFGREWRVSKLEMTAEGTWADLEFSRVVPISEMVPGTEAATPYLRPASVDMAWAAVENALATATARKNPGAIDSIRQANLVPLARGLFRLTQLLIRSRRSVNEIETHLRSLRFLQSGEYGRIPWDILPGTARQNLLRARLRPGDIELLDELFDGLPESLHADAREAAPSSTQPAA